jgi:NADPH:quinone reductase-like Zn-dependent oxidoreductase
MRAAVIHRLGPAESIRLETLSVPRPGPRDALVRVSATTVNPVDTFVRSGAYRTPMTFPFVVGRDLVGVVEGLGGDVSGFRVGDLVWSNSLGHGGRAGAAAEFACVPVERLYRLPHDADPLEFVATVHPAATAWLALVEHGRLAAGGTAFVGGGGGNVGSCAVGFAHLMNCRVVTTAGANDLERLATGGATVVDYRGERAGAEIEAALRATASTGRHAGADVWLDTSGTLTLSQSVPLLAERGRIVVIAGIAREDVLGFGELYTHDRSVVGFAISNATADELARAADAIVQAWTAGALPEPRIRTAGLDYAAAAHAAIERGDVHGERIVLVP